MYSFVRSRDIIWKMYSAVVAKFLCDSAKNSVRPRSILSVCTVVITCFYDAMDYQTPLNKDVRVVAEGIVKSVTQTPMYKSKVMLREPFRELFM